MSEQEYLRFIAMFSATKASGEGGGGGGEGGFHKGIMEHKVIMNLGAVNGDKSPLFRQWHQKFATAFGQVRGVREEIVHRLVKEIYFAKELEKVVKGLRGKFVDEFNKGSGDV